MLVTFASMGFLLDFRSCTEVDGALLDQAFAPPRDPDDLSARERVTRLLERMARVAKPGRGSERILIVLARLAGADWLGGRLEVTLRDFGIATEIDVRVAVAGRATPLRSLSIAVPIAELRDWAAANPGEIRPLFVSGEPKADEIRLRATSNRLSVPPPSMSVGSVWEGPTSTPPAIPPPSRTALLWNKSVGAPATAGAPVPGFERPPQPSQPMMETSTDVHNKQTLRVQHAELPKEAYRADEPEPRPPASSPAAAAPPKRKPPSRRPPVPGATRSTLRMPAVKLPARPAEGGPDTNDEGWE